jgi:hypothetical protein
MRLVVPLIATAFLSLAWSSVLAEEASTLVHQ